MRRDKAIKGVLAGAALAVAILSGCATPVGPVKVTRFHTPEVSARGTVAVEPAPGMDGQSLEFRSYAAAVARELNRLGYSELVAGGASSRQIAVLSVERESFRQGRDGSPVSVGVGGGTGGYGSGVGVGIGFDLSGPPPEQAETRMSVMIRDRASGRTVWEGRASFTVRAKSPLAETQLGAAKMAEALFRDFPGKSGETILVE
ncbi:MAG TPA: DUF4136 domain-containing protein [Novosphingobium sp.]|nr:DUF4136 domain-containing protein [Novosphingobium sp.]